VLFPANDGTHGCELWISDGTDAGTQMVRDLMPGVKGAFDSDYAYITTLGDRAYFRGSDSEHGDELWITDGTEAGTKLFADLKPGPASSGPFTLIVAGGKLYFSANNGPGYRLWVTDGGPPRIIAEPSGLAISGYGWPVNGKLYFSGSDGLHGYEPWVTDGTDAGTHIIANLDGDLAPSANPVGLTAAGNTLLFLATTDTSPQFAGQFLRSDGTAGGTYKLSDQVPDHITSAGSFAVLEKSFKQQSLTDGTIEGTVPATAFLRRLSSPYAGAFFTNDDALYVVADQAQSFLPSTLWKTSARTTDAPAIRLGTESPSGFVAFADRVFFYAGPGSNRGLWTTDGTTAGTYAVIPDLGVDYSALSNLATASGNVWFVKSVRNEQTTKLWKSDGTDDGTVVVKSSLPFVTNSIPEIAGAGRRVFFVVADSLWTSDGTDAGTVQLKSITRYPLIPHMLVPVGNRVVYTQYVESAHMYELWGSDGTVSGTVLLQSMPDVPLPQNIDGTVYFTGQDDLHGSEVWTTDGTPAGTKLLADVNPGPASSIPQWLTKAGNLLYFSAFHDATGRELWALPLTESLLSIADARIVEGNATTHFTVTLSQPASKSITVNYTTSDNTAHAGEDYDAVSGTLTFAPGETTKTIDVHVHGDASSESNESFFVTLSSANGAALGKGEATGVIEDDDVQSDLRLTTLITPNSTFIDSGVTVSNAGPRSATEVVITMTASPNHLNGCLGCALPQLNSGESKPAYAFTSSNEQSYYSAVVSARQNDPQPANNAATWTVAQGRSIAMDSAWLNVGQTATVTSKMQNAGAVPSSSDLSVVSVSAATGANGFAKFQVTGLKQGTATVTFDQFSLNVIVVASGTIPRLPGGIDYFTSSTAALFQQPVQVVVKPTGTAPFTGATPTGTMIVTSNGVELARQAIAGKDPITFPFYLPALGTNNYTISYSGDANFLPQTLTGSVFMRTGQATLIAVITPAGAPNTYSLTVRATGNPLVPPTGTLIVSIGGTEIGRRTLVQSAAELTFTTTTLSPTVSIAYSGDTFYDPSVQEARTVNPRQRPSRH
jgi:ELWxxDGT repeat protein